MGPRVVVSASIGDDVAEYLAAVREAGGDPVRVDCEIDPATALADADALLLTGGVDVDPSRYGGAHTALIGRTEPERDEFEETLLWDARERGIPTLCICRGIQIANVAFGGTLLADIDEELPRRAVAHRVPASGGTAERGLIEGHVVAIAPDSALAQIVGTTSLATGARHHQAVARVADELRVAGSTADGIVEVLEASFTSPFWLAVQWHPESTRELDGGASRALFAAFIGAAH